MIIIFILGALVYGYEDPSTCQLYNYLTHACLSCPTNTSPSTTGYCNCTGSFYPNPSTIGFNHADSCLDVGVQFLFYYSLRPHPLKLLVFMIEMVQLAHLLLVVLVVIPMPKEHSVYLVDLEKLMIPQIIDVFALILISM